MGFRPQLEGIMTAKTILRLGVLSIALGLGACTNPNDPGQRAVGGGLIGGAAGAGVGALAGGGTGALIGGVAGAAVGAGTGYITTPQRPANRY